MPQLCVSQHEHTALVPSTGAQLEENLVTSLPYSRDPIDGQPRSTSQLLTARWVCGRSKPCAEGPEVGWLGRPSGGR